MRWRWLGALRKRGHASTQNPPLACWNRPTASEGRFIVSGTLNCSWNIGLPGHLRLRSPPLWGIEQCICSVLCRARARKGCDHENTQSSYVKLPPPRSNGRVGVFPERLIESGRRTRAGLLGAQVPECRAADKGNRRGLRHLRRLGVHERIVRPCNGPRAR